MRQLNPLTQEALSVIQAIYEDHQEDRYAYRNEIHRLTASGLSSAFGSIEHFLDRYGYISIDQRHDALHLTSSGLAAAQGNEDRLKSLNDDIQYHFAKEIADGVVKDAQNFNAGKRFDQHYIRFEGIGRGGMGSVWRAEHLKTGRSVAIKTLEGIDEVVTSGRKSALKKRLERKIRQIAELDHPFICPVLDLSVHHTPPYYVMPLYTGGSLRDLLAQGPLQPEVALNIFSQICLGLHHAHQQGVLHLDLKPENILIDQRGNIRLFDFGMSRTIAKQVSQAGRQSYIGLGSVAYMAPELLRDPQAEAGSIDIYALGLVLYEMLVGELPGRRSPMPSDVIQGLPQPIDDLFDSMTQDSTKQRPQNMQEVLDILNQVPPFDRLSSQYMVMTFISPPFDLPGLKNIKLPELEENLDFQRSTKDWLNNEPSDASSKSKVAKPSPSKLKSQEQAKDVSTEEVAVPTPVPAPKSTSDQALSQSQFTPQIKSESQVPMETEIYTDSKPHQNQSSSQLESLYPSDEDQVILELASSTLPTESSSAPSPLRASFNQFKETQGIEEVELEEIEELEEVIDSAGIHQQAGQELVSESPIFSSTNAATHQAYINHSKKTDPHATTQDIALKFDQSLPDDFADDEQTALHHRTEVEEKPHLNQPHRSRRSNSIAQQLFEKQRKGNQFKQ